MGFAPDQGGTLEQRTEEGSPAAGVPPPAPVRIDKTDGATADQLIADDAWWAEEDFTGRRVRIRKRGREVTGFTVGGRPVELPPPIAEAVRGMLWAERCLLDGVAAGDVYHAFDALERDGQDPRLPPYSRRYAAAVGLADGCASNDVPYAPVATEDVTKRALLKQLKQLLRRRAQGVVFRRHDAPFMYGAPPQPPSRSSSSRSATLDAPPARAIRRPAPLFET